MNIATTSFARFGLAAVLMVTALGGMAGTASSARAAGGDLAAEQGPNAQECTGSGRDYRCRYCIVHDGGTDCFWVKVADPNRDNIGDPGLTQAFRVCDGAQACTLTSAR